jgi:hypothetical protein
MQDLRTEDLSDEVPGGSQSERWPAFSRGSGWGATPSGNLSRQG